MLERKQHTPRAPIRSWRAGLASCACFSHRLCLLARNTAKVVLPTGIVNRDGPDFHLAKLLLQATSRSCDQGPAPSPPSKGALPRMGSQLTARLFQFNRRVQFQSIAGALSQASVRLSLPRHAASRPQAMASPPRMGSQRRARPTAAPQSHTGRLSHSSGSFWPHRTQSPGLKANMLASLAAAAPAILFSSGRWWRRSPQVRPAASPL